MQKKSDALKMFEVTFGAKVTSIGSSSLSFPGPWPFRDGKTSRTEVAISDWSEIVCFFQHESLIFGFREKKTGTPSQFDGKKPWNFR